MQRAEVEERAAPPYRSGIDSGTARWRAPKKADPSPPFAKGATGLGTTGWRWAKALRRRCRLIGRRHTFEEHSQEWLCYARHTPSSEEMVYDADMGRTNIEIDETLVRKARKLTRLKTKREIVDAALELLVRSESRKGILRHYGTGIWKGELKAMRRNRG